MRVHRRRISSWSIWQVRQRRGTGLPPPVEALARMRGGSASRSMEMIRPPDPIPMMGADSGGVGHQLADLGVLEEGPGRGLMGLLHP
ncbi:hypothetical protein DMH15_30215 [Streptomyces sp. WAC 06725]|nr:hypothetical protein DMH15_30215 [Streptomyces sp. WAC 06725]